MKNRRYPFKMKQQINSNCRIITRFHIKSIVFLGDLQNIVVPLYNLYRINSSQYSTVKCRSDFGFTFEVRGNRSVYIVIEYNVQY